MVDHPALCPEDRGVDMRTMDDKRLGIDAGHELGIALGVRRIPAALAPVGDPQALSVAPRETEDQVVVGIDRAELVEVHWVLKTNFSERCR